MPFSPISANTPRRFESPGISFKRAQVNEPQIASGPPAGYVDPHQSPEAHAVNTFQIREVEHHQFAVGDQPVDFVKEKTAHAGNEPAAAMDDALLGFAFDFDGEGDRSGLGCHEAYLGECRIESMKVFSILPFWTEFAALTTSIRPSTRNTTFVPL
jgi:hypothetical protein